MSTDSQKDFSAIAAALLYPSNARIGLDGLGIINHAMNTQTDFSRMADRVYPPNTKSGIDVPGIMNQVASPSPYRGLLGSLGTDDSENGLWSLGQAQNYSNLSGLLNSVISPPPIVNQWRYVSKRFTDFQKNISLTVNQMIDGSKKYRGVVSCLNSAYWGNNSDSLNSFLVGSWAKDTFIRPPRDVDIYFMLPPDVYFRYERYGVNVNKQSALLQEVKGKLNSAYRLSEIRGDGPVVLAKFESYNVEVVPVFQLDDFKSYYICDTKNGGRYLVTKPADEVKAVEEADLRNNKNVRPLIRMLKCWQANCNVPIKSFHLELLAIAFLDQWNYRLQGIECYDWMCRDFFQWMISKANTYVVTPGTYEFMFIGDAWKTRAESAYCNAVKACELERLSQMLSAGEAWQKIYGTFVPRAV